MYCRLIILLFYFGNIQAQHYTPGKQLTDLTFRHIDHTNGLLSNSVLSITQDKQGFIWIGSTRGLQRYDGSRLVTYGDQNAYGLYAHPRNNNIYFYVGGTLNRVSLQHAATSIVANNYTAPRYFTDHTGMRWRVRFSMSPDADPHELTRAVSAIIGKADSSSDYLAFTVSEPGGKRIWLLNVQYGLRLLDYNTGKIYSAAFNPMHHPLLAVPLHIYNPSGISADGQGNIWLCTWTDRFFRYHLPTSSLSTYSTTKVAPQKGQALQSRVTTVFADNHRKVWLGTANAGLLLYNAAEDNFDYILHEQKNSNSLQYNYEIFCLFQDREENIWVGSDQGISVFNPYRRYFTTLRHEEDDPNSLPKSEITDVIATRSGHVLVATWGGGISVYDSLYRFKRLLTAPRKEYQLKLVWTFAEHDDGAIWAGCQHGYLLLIDPATWAVRVLHPPQMENSTIRSMLKDRQGNIWFGLHNGKIAKWNKNDQAFYAYNDSAAHIQGQTEVMNMFEDSAGIFWAITKQGLKQFDPVKRAFIASYLSDSINAPMKRAYNCCGLEQYNDSLLLVGIEDRGLYYFNKRSKSFTPIRLQQQPAPYTPYAIKKDRKGHIWFTTDYDIIQYDPQTKRSVTCNPQKGNINAPFVSTHFNTSAKGPWFTCTYAEVIGFDPDRINEKPTVDFPVTITGLKIFDNPVFVDSLLHAGKPIHLGYEQNFLTIEFAALQYSSVEHTDYYYQLSDVDKDWVYAGSKRFASYTDLSPGTYTFRVKAETGSNTGTITTVQFDIEMPFWQTTWFMVLGAAVGIALLYVFIRLRVNSVRRAAHMKQKIAETEMMALRAQMNPHFIFNCINSIDGMIQSNDKYHATVYLNKFARLIRHVLDSSRHSTISIARDLEILQLYIDMEQFRNEHKFVAEIRADEKLLCEDYRVPPLIIQPYVENAILHGLRNRTDNEGKLCIEVSKQNGHLIYIIEDNGVGRGVGQEPTHNRSYGMQMSGDRVKLFNKEEKATVEITDLKNEGQPAGTRVKVFLKIA